MNLRILLVPLLIACLGFTSCQTTDTIILPTGPKAAALGKAKDEQIAGLLAQVKAEQEARELADQMSSLAAANFDTIIFAATYVDTGLPRNAIEEEARLGKARSRPSNPAEVIKGKDRVIAILQNEVEKAKTLYGQAFDEAAQAKLVIDAKDKEIAARDVTIKNAEARIAILTDEAQVEKDAHKADVERVLAAKDAEIAKVKSDAASKERATWVLWTRIAGLMFIVGGAIIAIVFKIVPEGAAFVGVGVVIGLVSIFIDWVTAQWWFNYACGGTILVIIAIGSYALWRMWLNHQLDIKKTQAIQDMRDEAAAKGDTKAIDALDEHLEYRLGQDGSFWQKQQVKSEVALGLVDPKGEATLIGKS